MIDCLFCKNKVKKYKKGNLIHHCYSCNVRYNCNLDGSIFSYFIENNNYRLVVWLERNHTAIYSIKITDTGHKDLIDIFAIKMVLSNITPSNMNEKIKKLLVFS